jgi:hypothetical protein
MVAYRSGEEMPINLRLRIRIRHTGAQNKLLLKKPTDDEEFQIPSTGF